MRFLQSSEISGFILSFFLIYISAVLSPPLLHSQTQYPEIEQLNREDPLFLQATSDVDAYYRSTRTDEGITPPLAIFSYRPGPDETLFTVAARCNLPYESIALLNSFSNPEDIKTEAEILIPNTPGIFIPLAPKNEIGKLLASWRADKLENGTEVVVRIPERDRRRFVFLPGERFHSVERAFFLNVLFRFPLPDGVVTSGYGERISPFTHRSHFHHGIDIAAPRGTDVYASWKGVVEHTGVNKILGNYLVLTHSNDFRTIYGHLEKILVKRGTSVGTGSIIGYVGSSGLSTGPHLHFEIRKSGESWDPSEMIPVKDR